LEYPQYAIKQSMKRVLVPSLFRLAILSSVFYVAILININLAVKYRIMTFEINTLGYLGIALSLVFLMILEILIIYKKTDKMIYKFYTNRIEYGEKPVVVYYTQILSPEIRQDRFFDRVFNTASIRLADNAKIDKIETFNQVFMYIQQLKRMVMHYGYGRG